MFDERSAVRGLIENVIVAVAYWGVSWANYQLFSQVGFSPSPIWPAAALALVVAFFRGWRIFPGLALGAFAANHFAMGGSLALAGCVAVTNSVGPLAGAAVLRARVTRRLEFSSLMDGAVCLAGALLVAPLCAGLGGATAKWLLHLIPPGAFGMTLSKWGMAHLLGTFFFAIPAFVFLSARRRGDHSSFNARDGAAVWAVSLAVASFFWLADSVFVHLWFHGPADRSFLRALFPVDDARAMFMRLFVVFSIGICAAVITRVMVSLVERKQAADRVAKQLRITLDSIGDAVISTDIEGRVSRMNPVAERLTGWTQVEARGRPLPEVFEIVNAFSREAVKNPVEKVFETGEIVGLANHTVLIARDGTERQIADSAAPIRNGSGEVFGVILVFRDVTEEYALQEQLNHSHRMDAIGQLAGGVAHDFNNMLGGIMGAAELQRELRVGDDEEEFAGLNQVILDSAARAAELTRQLLAFSRRQRQVSSCVDARKCLAAAVALLRKTTDRRVEIEEENAVAEALVVGDPSQLQNAFLNLGLNAAQAMPRGGRLSIRSQVTELEPAYCETSSFELRPGEYLEVEFRDSGCGIDSKHLPKIFEPFFSTKEQGEGTGLGLSTVYGTVQQHQGAITVYSEVGVGSSFRVLLPLAEAGGGAEPPPPETAAERGEGRILVVDDENVIRATAKAMLEGLGYEVLVADNGRIGLEVFEREHETIDLVIVDMVMPEMNGRDCFAGIRAIAPDARVVLASGFSRAEDVAAMREAGLRGFINKPYCRTDLSKVVRDALRD